MDWKEKAIKILKDSLYPIPSELNELDWKSGLSDKTDRLAQHLSAFANMKGGGILVYGVHNDGTCFDLTKEEIDRIVQTLGNIAQNNLVYAIPVEHSVMSFEGHSLLFIYIRFLFHLSFITFFIINFFYLLFKKLHIFINLIIYSIYYF
jgi:hypothetical protein